ncbi:GNAT family N-acetyltransferase [Kineococcus xinjiangensis]|uniref:GNAT family N-acetyltransferase n=1 Tax=Kineococcus xinjiangensis TaxID=512762 RepID=UPI0013049E6D|nr:GNAT family N-acetyltransferase [Kineococcus xinjiangensis]
MGDALLQARGCHDAACASPAVEVGPARQVDTTPLPAVGPALRTGVHRDLTAVSWEEWRRLLAASGASFFSGPDWLRAVAQHLGGAAPLLVTVRSRGQLLAVGAFALAGTSRRPVVTFLGSGASDYATVLVGGARVVQGEALVDAVLDAAVAALPGALFDLEQVRSDDPLLPDLLSWAQRRGYGLRAVEQAVCTSVLLPPTVAEHDEQLPAGVRRGERRQRRRLAERGSVRLVADLLSGADLPSLVAELAAVDDEHPHAERRHRPWRGASGALLAQVCATAPREQVWLSGLRVDGELVAYNLGFAGERVVHGYLQSYRARYAASGPGSLLLLHLRRRSIASDRLELDMLRGEEDYKRRLAPGTVRTRTNVRVTMAPGGRGPLPAVLDRASLLRRTFRDEVRASAVLSRCADGLAAGSQGVARGVEAALREGRRLRGAASTLRLSRSAP